jgi:hypothetical protein
MTISARVIPAVRAAFEGLIDYAGLFPPARLEMKPALEKYVGLCSGPDAWMLGRFVVPLSRLPELLSALPQGRRLPLSVIADAGYEGAIRAAALTAERRVTVEALEARLEPPQVGEFAAALRAAGVDSIPAFVEFRRDAAWEQTVQSGMNALRNARIGAKIRCGGTVAEAFPTPGEIAVFVTAAARHGVAFKATAGLHHPVRLRDASTGFTVHGFLNLLAAAALSRRRAGIDALNDVLSCEDPQAFAFDERGFTVEAHAVSEVFDARAIAQTRALSFLSYGSCSFEEPAADLRALGTL